MKITSHKISVPRTAHYSVCGNLTDRTREIWIVLHGYGQQANEFLNIFRNLADNNRAIIAPEALSSFYLRRSSGKTGASWMTSTHRLDEMADYLNYLDILAEQIRTAATANPRIILLGFSQGSETAVRWFLHTKIRLEKLVVWSGFLPPELSIKDLQRKNRHTVIYLVHGNRDRLFPVDVREKLYQELGSANINFEKIEFNGGHGIDQHTLSVLVSSFSG